MQIRVTKKHHQARNMIFPRKLLFWIILIVFTCLSPIIILEFSLRAIYGEEEVNGNYWGIGAFEPSASLGFLHKANFTGYAVRKNVFKTFIKINNINLRQSDYNEQIKNSTRVLLLGDSFAFGLGVEEHKNFTSLINQELNPYDIGIINGAQTGYCVEQERLLGVILSDSVRPKVILLALFPDNDIQGDYLKDFKNIDVKFGYRLSKNRFSPIVPIDFLRTHSYLWLHTGAGRLDQIKEPQKLTKFNQLAKIQPEEVIIPTLNSLQMLSKYCEQFAISFAVVLIPPPKGSTIFDIPLKNYFEAEKIKVLDLTTKDFQRHDYFVGDGHWNEAGHTKAATHITPFIKTML